MNRSVRTPMLDAAAIGSGVVDGLDARQRLRGRTGLQVQGFDDAGDVGGAWYWNRSPGCRVDTEAAIDCYAFDGAPFRTWRWSERHPRPPEAPAYLSTVADRHDLRHSIRFRTRSVRAEWDEASALWHLTAAPGTQVAARSTTRRAGRPRGSTSRAGAWR